jgi:transposase InsO family protein
MPRKRRQREAGRRDKVGGPGTVIRYRSRSVHPLEFRVRLVREVLEQKTSLGEVGRIFGVNKGTLYDWVKRYEEGGLEGLAPARVGAKPKRKSAPAVAKREAVAKLRQEHPEYGTRKISDMLRRFAALGVSETVVRRILHEEGLLLERASQEPARAHPPRRFERAAPNQLWQSDIFTFLLRRHERLYLAAFMDDHSRFIVSYALAHRQKSELVMEALERGIAEYGAPQEILTDQGRQYVSWRGKTAFVEELRRQGIEHIKSRPQHPQTLGKVERFWKTLWEEFLSRTVFADFADCDRRLRLYIDGYNFQRPHQGIEGLTPADRFFRAAPQVRAAVEQAVATNATRLALEKPLQKPFYLVGRLGDQDLSIAAGGGGLKVQMGDVQQTIKMPKERDDEERSVPARVRREEGRQAEASVATDAEVAFGEAGARRGREAAMSDGAGGAVGSEAGDGRDRERTDVARDVLQARGTGAGGHAAGAVTDGGTRRDGWASAGDGAGTGGGAGGEAGEVGAGETTRGQALRDDEEAGEEGADDDRRGATAGERGRDRFDPNAGWRERALTWERKLAGADAESEARGAEGQHEPAREEDAELHAGTRDRAGGGASGAGGAEGGVGAMVGDRGGRGNWNVTPAIPDADAPESGGDGVGAGAEGAWTPGGADATAGAGEREYTAASGERETAGSRGDDRSPAGGGERHAEGADRNERAAGEEAELIDLDLGDALEEGEQ